MKTQFEMLKAEVADLGLRLQPVWRHRCGNAYAHYFLVGKGYILIMDFGEDGYYLFIQPDFISNVNPYGRNQKDFDTDRKHDLALIEQASQTS